MKKQAVKIVDIVISLFLFSFAGPADENPRITPAVKAISRVIPSVVNIGTERVVTRSYSPWGMDPFESLLEDFHGQRRTLMTTSLGSGIIIDGSGLVVTNSHVVHHATKIRVALSDGKEYTAKEIANNDLNDIALLCIEDLPDGVKLPPVSFAVPEDLILGEPVIAVGNPYGLGHSISKGVLSARGRKAVYKGKVIFSDILQTDAAINPGNSGGPLVNIHGELIGINTAVHREAEGIGFAIPLKRLEDLLARWLIPERFSDVGLGLVPGANYGAGSAEFFVSEIIKDSPADEKGLEPGTVIHKVNGRKPAHLIEFSRILWKMRAGDKLSLETENGKVELTVRKNPVLNGKELAAKRLGIGLQPLTKKLAIALEYPFSGGLLISDLDPDIEGLKRGDILVRIDDIPTYTLDDIPRALKERRYGDAALVCVIRIVPLARAYSIEKRTAVIKVK